MTQSNNAYHTLRPTDDGYLVPEEEEGQHALMCCSNGRANRPVSGGMAFVGSRGGDYVQETRYRYIGKGQGSFSLVGPKGEEETRCSSRAKCCLLGLLLISGVSLAILLTPEVVSPELSKVWSLVPEKWHTQLQQVFKQTSEFIVHTPSEGQRVFMSMIVTNVDFDRLMAVHDVFQHFVTELKQAVALTAAEHIAPEAVALKVTKAGRGVRVDSTINLPSDLSTREVGFVRDALHYHVETPVVMSLQMITGIEDLKIVPEDKMSIQSVEVYLASSESEQAKS